MSQVDRVYELIAMGYFNFPGRGGLDARMAEDALRAAIRSDALEGTPPAPSPVSTATEASGGAGEAQEG